MENEKEKENERNIKKVRKEEWKKKKKRCKEIDVGNEKGKIQEK